MSQPPSQGRGCPVCFQSGMACLCGSAKDVQDGIDRLKAAPAKPNKETPPMKFPDDVVERVSRDSIRPSRPSPHQGVIRHALAALTADDLARALGMTYGSHDAAIQGGRDQAFEESALIADDAMEDELNLVASRIRALKSKPNVEIIFHATEHPYARDAAKPQPVCANCGADADGHTFNWRCRTDPFSFWTPKPAEVKP